MNFPNLSAWAVRERAITLFMIIALITAGSIAFLRIGRAEDPSFTIKVLTVAAVWPGATAEQMQDLVADPLEKRLQELQYYDRVETFTRPGMALMTLFLKDSTPPAVVESEFYQARKKLGDEAHNLPTGVFGPFINDEYSDVSFAVYAVKGKDLQPRTITRYSEDLREQLLHVAGIKKVQILGERPEKIFVDFNYTRLAELGINPTDIFAALSRQNNLTPAGSIDTEGPQVFVRIDGEFTEEETVANTPVSSQGRTFKLSDIAEVKRGYEDPATFLIRHNGDPCMVLSVVIIACPCALGLATPMSVMVGIGRSAREGVLIRNAEAIEVMEKITTVVVDKTGTLTEGKPRLTQILLTDGVGEDKLLLATASVERNSEHPLAAAIVHGANERGMKLQPVTDFASVTGGGVIGKIDGHELIIGKLKFLHERRVTNLETVEQQAAKLQAEGQTVMFVAINGSAAGILTVSDPIKTSTPEAIAQLHRLGLKIIMLTGDNERTANAVAKKLGLDQVKAGIEPQHKHERIQQLRQQGHIVAMAGDGINDAPALAAAHVGIAMGTGTDVAMESAGITLVKGDLRGIVKTIALSRSMMRNIRQNLFFAFVYNALGIPVAAGLLYPFFGLLLSPIIAGAAMSLSSVSVIGNALRLRNAKL